MKNIDIDWVLCPRCGHKLLKDVKSFDYDIEIKCSSCKEVSRIVKINGRRTQRNVRSNNR